MMKTKILFLIILCLPVISQAQLSQNLSKRFPAYIIYKIEDVVSKINLTEDKQIQIGNKLLEKDRLANISLTNGKPASMLKSCYTIDINFLKPILSKDQLESYEYEMNKDNRFLAALKFAKELKLDAAQISEIRKQNFSLGEDSKMSAKETIWVYDDKLFQILSKDQFILLHRIIYKEQSMEDAKNDWDKIIKLKLVANENDKTEFVKILMYHFVKNGFLDKKAERYDKAQRDLWTNKIALEEPFLLIHVNILSDGNYADNKYSSVIKCEKELELTKKQIDTLLFKYSQLERIKFENKEKESTAIVPKAVPSEYDDVTKILTTDQVKKWLLNKNLKEAKRIASRNWEQLQVEGLTTGLDKDKTLTELSVYQLKYLVARERGMIDHTQDVIFFVRDVEKEKPELLKQLDALIAQSKSKNTTAKSVLTW
ncbi:hypothetical protein EOD40_16240 [Flavobacterium sufflavum]|uniref:Uncharacterized protein n=1 Tax=Flavobacterium sufflavum TaxID=1921138 RepID=A0A3S2U1U2_9FLAO|nr:hypothetical protein [Flavobacterium sufflavum]RVT71969.1 hypothetical protein EOD40_16240 [Flavobacterium sufflavum]